MKRWIGVLLLAGCTSAQPLYKPVMVDVPVPCAAAPPPASPLKQLPPDAPLFDKVKAALTEIALLRQHDAQREAACFLPPDMTRDDDH